MKLSNLKSHYKKTMISFVLLGASIILYGQNAAAQPVQSRFSIDTHTLLILLAVFLLLPVWILSKTFMASARRFHLENKKSSVVKVLLPFIAVLTSSELIAQGSTSESGMGLNYNGMTILLLCVVVAELMLILFFANKTNDFIGVRKLELAFPRWLTISFIITSLFGIGYAYRHYMPKSTPSETEELANDPASMINETNVAVMTGADLDAGKETFVKLCAVCHKTNGGGMVGPNLTDDYWLHGGSLQDLFKTIKYGYPDKGMISWKEQLSPIQMAQVSNYILTLRGTNPPDAKPKQGDLYVPNDVVTDTTVMDTNTMHAATKVSMPIQ